MNLPRNIALLWSQANAQAACQTIPEEAVRLQFAKPKKEITRRQFLELAMPEYTLVPYVIPAKCIGEERCHICQDGCPASAIKLEKGKALIDKATCCGCGACAAICPHNAISYPRFSFEEMDREMAGLLSASDLLEPRILALVGKNCTPDKMVRLRYPTNVLPLAIPCPAMAAPWLMLRAFDLGVQGLALILNECRLGLSSDKWLGNAIFVAELLDKLGIEPERVKIIKGDEPEEELFQFAKDVGELRTTLLRSSDSKDFSNGEASLPVLINSMAKKQGVSLSGVVTAGDVPFGKLRLESSRCTGCGLCALNCPTEALAFALSEEGAYQLLFWQQTCTGCGQCVNSCPEECLHLEKRLELECLTQPPSVLSRNELVRCRECGAPIAPQSMLTRLAEKLSDSKDDTSYLSLCPNCRIKSEFDLARR